MPPPTWLASIAAIAGAPLPIISCKPGNASPPPSVLSMVGGPSDKRVSPRLFARDRSSWRFNRAAISGRLCRGASSMVLPFCSSSRYVLKYKTSTTDCKILAVLCLEALRPSATAPPGLLLPQHSPRTCPMSRQMPQPWHKAADDVQGSRLILPLGVAGL